MRAVILYRQHRLDAVQKREIINVTRGSGIELWRDLASWVCKNQPYSDHWVIEYVCFDGILFEATKDYEKGFYSFNDVLTGIEI